HAIRPLTKLPLETHLMIADPDKYLEDFVHAGSDTFIVHVEAAVNLHRTLQHVKSLGKKAGVVFNPATPVAAITEVVPDVDLILVMTVNPGFGGQHFIPSTLSKIRQVRELIDRVKPGIELEVDGGIDHETAPAAVQAGARVLVAGTSVFGVKEGVAAG